MFYVSGLGFTRDPYVDFGVFNFNNMWVNVGDQQFHLPQGKAATLPRHDRSHRAGSRQAALAARSGGKNVDRNAVRLATHHDDHIDVTCPWGNRLRCHAPDETMTLGIRYLEMDVPAGSASRHRELLSRRIRDAGHLRQRRCRGADGDQSDACGSCENGRRGRCVRRSPHRNLRGELFGSARLARRTRADHRGDPISISIASRPSSIRRAATVRWWNSSTRCAACGTRCGVAICQSQFEPDLPDVPSRSRSVRAMTRTTQHEAAPYYLPIGDELDVFEAAYEARLPVLLKGPTGCGKTRFVEYMTWRLYRQQESPRQLFGEPLVTVSCHEDLTATDLVGRYLLRADEAVWMDGPLTRAVRTGVDLLSRRDRRGAQRHDGHHPFADRPSAHAADREDRVSCWRRIPIFCS